MNQANATAARTAGEANNPALWAGLKPLARILTTLLFDLHVYGIHYVPRKGGVLLVSNHQSYLDPVLAAVRLPRPVSFMAKSELFENPAFSWLIRSLNAFGVRRGEGDVGAIREAIRRLQEGRVLVLFPEGTRSRCGEINPIQPGIAMLIRRAQVPVVPAVIDGSGRAWPRGRRMFRPHPIRIMYGPPLALEGLKGHAVVELIGHRLRDMMDDLRATYR